MQFKKKTCILKLGSGHRKHISTGLLTDSGRVYLARLTMIILQGQIRKLKGKTQVNIYQAQPQGRKEPADTGN